MRSWLLGVLGFVLGCQTQFTGSAHVSVTECQARCTADGMQMAGMVYMGEYSSACVCELSGAAPASPTSVAPGAVGAVAGVMMQMRRAHQQQQRQQWQMTPTPTPISTPGQP